MGNSKFISTVIALVLAASWIILAVMSNDKATKESRLTTASVFTAAALVITATD